VYYRYRIKFDGGAVTITISTTDPRSLRALALAASAGQWLKWRGYDGNKRYGVPSQSTPGLY
jgi:hypothetical protein